MRTPATSEAAFSPTGQSGTLMFQMQTLGIVRSSSEVSLAGFRVADLERGEQDAPLLVHRGVSGELQRQQALVDRGGRGDAGGGGREKGDDVQAPVVKAAKQPVEVVLLATASPGRRVRPW